MSGAAQAQPEREAAAELAFIDHLYREGERFRAESEILRFLHDHPDDPRRDAVELARAKLYFQERRYGESALMLHSLLDRIPEGEAAADGLRLLAFNQLMEGRPAEAAATLRLAGASAEALSGLAALAEPPLGRVDPDRAVAWSTALPGAGFFLLDQPGKAAAALSLNLAFAAGAVIAYRQENTGAALALLLVEIALYSGGRQAVRQEAETLLARQERARREAWLAAQGASELLAVGIRLDFGGD
jgi:fermentation-respiration switch protein FrsA (DUF1100 family)